MRLSEGVEWSLHCCSLLGALPEDTALPAARLAEFHDVPAAYLAKQLQALSGAGIVAAVPGRRGGYRLARPAADVTMLDVVLAVEGADPAFRCSEIRRRGPSGVAAEHYVQPCGIARAMGEAEFAWREALRAVTIADLVAEANETVVTEQIQKAVNWLGRVLQ